MNFQDLFVGALTVNSKMFDALRERSDVFWRGFMVLLFAGLFAGVFGALPGAISEIAPQATKEQVIQIARAQFESNYRGPAQDKATYEEYVDDIASAVYDVIHLPPRAGEGARPVAAVLGYIGNVLATPFSSRWIEWILFMGLLFHFTARLLGGRASMAQMLGLTALATAPQIFFSLVSVLMLVQNATATPLIGVLVGALGFVISLWTAVIYVKGTAVAQKFTVWRAIGTIVLGYVLLIGAIIVFSILVALLLGGLLTAVPH